uniref:Uncharacterized protein n=1 Tax=Ciona intestinalis TaxID=7719 RepID=F6W3U0_CIOIN
MYECNTRHRFVCMKYEALATPVRLTIHQPNSLTFLSGVYEPEEGRIQRGSPIYKARNGATFKATGELPGGEARYWNVMDSRNIQQIVILTTAKYPQEVAITNIRYWVSGQPGTQQLPPGRRVRMEIISYFKWRPWAQWS